MICSTSCCSCSACKLHASCSAGSFCPPSASQDPVLCGDLLGAPNTWATIDRLKLTVCWLLYWSGLCELGNARATPCALRTPLSEGQSGQGRCRRPSSAHSVANRAAIFAASSHTHQKPGGARYRCWSFGHRTARGCRKRALAAFPCRYAPPRCVLIAS